MEEAFCMLPVNGAWIAETTGMINLSTWPEGSRLILRKEGPHPGAQFPFTDVDGHRITAFLTDTPPGKIPGQAAELELRHREHARAEDRIRQANLPCRGREETAPGWRPCSPPLTRSAGPS